MIGLSLGATVSHPPKKREREKKVAQQKLTLYIDPNVPEIYAGHVDDSASMERNLLACTWWATQSSSNHGVRQHFSQYNHLSSAHTTFAPCRHCCCDRHDR